MIRWKKNLMFVIAVVVGTVLIASATESEPRKITMTANPNNL